jgi:acetyl esterase/lipase
VPPATGHSILEDVKDLFDFLARENIYNATCAAHSRAFAEAYKFEIDKEAIVVAGTSAGGLCAYLAAIHCQPKPKALFSIYGMGGDFFVSRSLFHCIFVWTEPIR